MWKSSDVIKNNRANLYKWEHNKVIPSPAMTAKIAAYRNMGRKALWKKTLGT